MIWMAWEANTMAPREAHSVEARNAFDAAKLFAEEHNAEHGGKLGRQTIGVVRGPTDDPEIFVVIPTTSYNARPAEPDEAAHARRRMREL